MATQQPSLTPQHGPTPRFLMLTLLACLLSMGISYLTVRYLTRDLSVREGVETAAIQRDQLLRSCSNELLKLVESYIQRVPNKDRAANPSGRRWIAQTFRPRINQLRFRLADDQFLATPPGGNLLAAADLAATLSGRAGEAGRRRIAGETLRACAAAERYIAAHGVRRYLSEPAYLAGFDEDT